MIADDHLEFLHAVWTRKTPFTYFFLALNILIFVLMAFGGGSMNEPTLLAFGVKANAEIARGEWLVAQRRTAPARAVKREMHARLFELRADTSQLRLGQAGRGD